MARQPNKKGGEFVRFTAVAAEAIIENNILTFEPPLIDRAPNPEAFRFWWRMLQFIFPDIADPRSFPTLTQPLDQESLKLCQRFIVAAEELAESQLLGADDQMTVHLDDDTGEEHVEAIETSKEITRGFSTLLRQFDGKGEPASFLIVSGRLRKASAAETDGLADARCARLDAWRAARGKLQAKELKRLVRNKVDPNLEFGSEHSPVHLFSAYQYGDLIHWDSKRDVVAAWERDPFHKHNERLAFLGAAAGLAHLYIGFSELVRTAIGE